MATSSSLLLSLSLPPSRRLAAFAARGGWSAWMATASSVVGARYSASGRAFGTSHVLSTIQKATGDDGAMPTPTSMASAASAASAAASAAAAAAAVQEQQPVEKATQPKKIPTAKQLADRARRAAQAAATKQAREAAKVEAAAARAEKAAARLAAAERAKVEREAFRRLNTVRNKFQRIRELKLDIYARAPRVLQGEEAAEEEAMEVRDRVIGVLQAEAVHLECRVAKRDINSLLEGEGDDDHIRQSLVANAPHAIVGFQRRIECAWDADERIWVPIEPRTESVPTVVVLIGGRQLWGLGIDGFERLKERARLAVPGSSTSEEADEKDPVRVITILLGRGAFSDTLPDEKDGKRLESIVDELLVRKHHIMDVEWVSPRSDGFRAAAFRVLWALIASIADQPYRERKRGVLPIAISSAPTVGTLKGTTAQETFETLFNPVLRVSRVRAKALARRAGSLRNLMEEYERLGEEKGRLLFEEELVNGRRMGPVLSAFVYDVFRQEDGRATILEPEEETETEEGDTT